MDVTMSPLAWVEFLHKALNERNAGSKEFWSSLGADYGPNTPDKTIRPPLWLLARYREGRPRLPLADAAWEEKLVNLYRMCRMNYAGMVVESMQHRVELAGIRLGTSSEPEIDRIVANFTERIALGSEITKAVGKVSTFGTGYLVVTAVPGSARSNVWITSEDPRNTITYAHPITGQTLAALTQWVDKTTGILYGCLRLPGVQYNFVLKEKTYTNVYIKEYFNYATMNLGEPVDVSAFYGNTVPVFSAETLTGLGEFEPHLDLLDRITDGLVQRTYAAKLQAMRQRAVTGLPDRDANGKVIDWTKVDILSPAPGSLTRLPAGIDFWESQTTDLSPLRMAVRDDVEALCAQTFTPLYYMFPETVQASATGATAQREGNWARTKQMRQAMSAALRPALELALDIYGRYYPDPTVREALVQGANFDDLNIVWGAAELNSMGEKANAAVQAKAAGVPWRSRMIDVMGYDPDEISRLEAERDEDIVTDQLVNPNNQLPMLGLPGGADNANNNDQARATTPTSDDGPATSPAEPAPTTAL